MVQLHNPSFQTSVLHPAARPAHELRYVRIFRCLSLCVLVPIVVSVAGVLEFQTTRFALVSLFLLLLGATQLISFRHAAKFTRISMLSVGLAVVIGLANTSRANANSLGEWLEYSVLAAASLIAFQCGWNAKATGSRAVLRSLSMLALSEFLTIAAKVASVGVFGRSSVGTAPTVGYVIASARGVMSATAVYIPFMFFTLATSMRSILMGAIVVTWVYGLSFLKPRRIFPFIIASTIAVALLSFNSDRIFNDYLGQSIQILEARFQQTLLNKDEFRLDPDAGRLEEAEAAWREFNSNAIIADYLIGRGYGFVFTDWTRADTGTAHVHLTPLAFYLREGLLGALRYGWLVIWVGCALALRVLYREKDAWQLMISAVLVAFSLISGYLLDPLYWIFLGYSLNRPRMSVARNVILRQS